MESILLLALPLLGATLLLLGAAVPVFRDAGEGIDVIMDGLRTGEGINLSLSVGAGACAFDFCCGAGVGDGALEGGDGVGV